MKDKVSSRHRDPLLGTFATSRKNASAAIAALKTARTYRQAKNLLAQLRIYGLDRELYGEKKFKNWDVIIARPLYPPSVSWVEEVGWIAHGICAYASDITAYIECRRRFGAAIIRGDYQTAQSQLDLALTLWGCSFWLAERQLMLRQFQDGFDAHKQYLGEILSTTSNSAAAYIISILSNRLEPHARFDVFNKSVEESLADLKQDGYNLLSGLIESHVSPWTFKWTERYPEMLHWCNGRPLPDRYNLLIKYLSQAPVNQLSEPEMSSLSHIIGDIRERINDPQLAHIEWSLFGKSSKPAHDDAAHQYYTAYDELVMGRPRDCERHTAKLLADNPLSFDLYWLLARSKTYLELGTRETFTDKCTAADILRVLETVALNRIDLNLPFASLQTFGLKLGENHLGISLWQFAEHSTSGVITEAACRYAAITGSIHSAESLTGMHGRYRKACVDWLLENKVRHPSILLYLYANGQIPRDEQIPSGVTGLFRDVARAERASFDGRFNEVLVIVNSLRDGREPWQHHAGTIARLHTEALVELNQPQDAAAATLEYYITNRNLLRDVAFEALVSGALNGKWPHLKNTIYWPILVFLNNGDAQDLYEAVDDFIANQGYASPLEILAHINDFPNAALRVLLRDVLISRVIARGALWAKTPDAHRQMRTKVLQALYSLSVEDQADIVKELSEIEQAEILEEAYRNVEGPKFFMELSEINRGMVRFLESSYERYISYRIYEEKGGQLTVEGDLLEMAKSGTAVRQVTERRAEASETLLSNLATIVFIQYLWDPERGVNATLSTRIRHGSLENQMKRVFGAYSILATRNLEGEFECQRKVLNELSVFGEEQQSDVQCAYVVFTEEIERIFRVLITESLRIRVPDGVVALVEKQGLPAKESAAEQGLLDFTELFNPARIDKLKTLQLLAVDTLLAELQDMFLESAKSAFANVRLHLGAVVAREIDNAVSALDGAIVRLLDDGPQRAALRNDILAAKDGFVHDLRVIENWFSIAERMETGAGTIQKLISTAARVVGFASNGKLGRVKAHRLLDEAVSPSVGVVLYEVLSILMRNIVQHSNVHSGQEVEYDWNSETDGTHKLVIRNRLISSSTCRQAVESARHRLLEPNDPRVLDRSPGGTGLARVRALLSQVSNKKVMVSVDQAGDDQAVFSATVIF